MVTAGIEGEGAKAEDLGQQAEVEQYELRPEVEPMDPHAQEELTHSGFEGLPRH